jgi:uncharacterized repeat protein (TIGR03803 family)
MLSGNRLYGTATYGGSSGLGTVFAINVDGSGFETLHNFSATSGILFSNLDGAHPQGSLVGVGDILYGTAADGGASGNGVVYMLNTNGSDFTTLHSFSAAYYNVSGFYTNLEGANPSAGLSLSSNTLYGTTLYGGRAGQGVVFALNTNGNGFANVHNFSLVAPNFQGVFVNGDGANPACTLSISGTTLFGTAQNGGTRGYGTIFALKSDGSAITILRNFNPSTDGANPVASLLLTDQTLFGTAAFGGSSGAGTLFRLETSGNGFTNLYNFSAPSSQTNRDGAVPVAPLVFFGDTLYGTTYQGGGAGSGTLFAFPSGPSLAPRLGISVSAQMVTLTWPADALGFSLQSSTNLNSPLFWTNVSSTPVLTNGKNSVTNLLGGEPTFFRLSR